jgi:hypothetical protein
MLLVFLAMASVGAVAIVRADDPAPPGAPAPKGEAPKADAPKPANPKPAAKPPASNATQPAANPADSGDVEGPDYDKNATKRFAPTERTPADRNVSFPVDI